MNDSMEERRGQMELEIAQKSIWMRLRATEAAGEASVTRMSDNQRQLEQHMAAGGVHKHNDDVIATDNTPMAAN